MLHGEPRGPDRRTLNENYQRLPLYYSTVNKLRNYEHSTPIYISDFMTLRNFEDQLQKHSVHSVNWINKKGSMPWSLDVLAKELD